MRGATGFVVTGLLAVLALTPPAVSGDGQRHDLGEILSRLPRGELMEDHPIPAYSRLMEFVNAGAKWVSGETFARAGRDLLECITHYERLKNGPWKARAEKLRARVKLDPAWANRDFDLVVRPPYMICAETGEDAGNAYGDALHRLEQVFSELFAEPLKLSPPDGDGGGRKVYVFRDSESFTAYQKVIRQPLPPGVTGLYRPTDQWVIAVDVPLDSGARARVLHNAAHQLVHAWTKSLVERATREDLVWSDKRLHSKSLWFQEGLAEMLSATREDADGQLAFMVPLESRLKEWRAVRKAKRLEWSLPELLSFRGMQDLRRAALKKGPGTAPHLNSLFYAQAWSFCWFLWNAEGGKYRKRFLAYAKKELHGASGKDVFAEVWAEGGPPDWAALEAEWLAYATRQMAALD